MAGDTTSKNLREIEALQLAALGLRGMGELAGYGMEPPIKSNKRWRYRTHQDFLVLVSELLLQDEAVVNRNTKLHGGMVIAARDGEGQLCCRLGDLLHLASK